MLKATETALAAMRAHAEEGYPLEICGFLVGSLETGGRAVQEAWPVRNAWEDDPALRATLFASLEAGGGAASLDQWESGQEARRYLVAPRDILACMKRARDQGLDLVGVYHTHPDHPAEPSAFDRDAAWPDWSYLILSVRAGKVADVRSWVLDQDADSFREERIERTG